MFRQNIGEVIIRTVCCNTTYWGGRPRVGGVGMGNGERGRGWAYSYAACRSHLTVHHSTGPRFERERHRSYCQWGEC